MFFVDTHCHLTLDPLRGSVNQVVEAARESGVTKMVVPGLNVETSIEALELSSRFEGIYAAVGIHPNEKVTDLSAQLRQIEALASETKVVAIGEIGLDFYRHPENASYQKELLQALLEIALNCHKPVIFHSRNALEILLEISSEWAGRWKLKNPSQRFCGVFHSHEGDMTTLPMIREQSFAIGIGGPVTYKNAIIKQDLVKHAGLENLVLETDAPFLSPHPYRGKVNEPRMIPVIAEKVADLLQTSVQDVAERTSTNADTLFRWDAVN